MNNLAANYILDVHVIKKKILRFYCMLKLNFEFFETVYLLEKLKSVNSNFTLTVHSPKLNQAKTHFLSHLGEKKRKNMARPGFKPTR